MKNYLTLVRSLIALTIFCGVLISCEQKRPLKTCETFAEMEDPTSDTLSDWSQSLPGLNASFVSIDTKYPKSVMPQPEKNQSCKLTGWKGEKLSGQLLLWSAKNIQQVECEFGDFKSSDGTVLSNIAQARFVRYVMTDIFEPGCGYRKPEDFPASLTADMLDNLECFNIDAKTARPVWLTVSIPQSAKAGIYTGKLKVYARDQKTQEFEISLEVQDRTLPTPSEWAYHLDLWQHPSAVARVQNLKVWSDEHFEALKPLMKMLADAGQKVITANINKEPWNNQCFDPYADMITWTKNADGTWSYDYTIFDRWVQMMMDIGINKMINCYSMIPWNNEIHYTDAVSGKVIDVKADPGTKIFVDMWTPFLTDFTKHLKEKKWLEITNIAMDERSPESMKATVELLQKVSPELGISLADNHQSYKKYPFIKDMCVAAGAKVDSADITMRREKGLITTYYVCCSDKFPNVFTCSDPAEAVYASWYAIAADYDGFLRWAYNSWVENPLTDSRFRTWPGGDTYIVYPDARSSIRFERLIEGIQDFEKIRMLRQDLEKANTTESLSKLDKLNTEVAKFNTIEPKEPYVDMLNKAKTMINELSR
ncbi:glycoside hydrolase domain-containing protein [Dysgonomonas sp. ZJ709]|uniref:DUF4091 domain-containing protein n=1 Tax=Dysgonomonas sp. ZJ709 TaxID=2709797 RepID=UPI00210833DE|nr:glycoside hydrolase domain-containing protein [Dysgonomonas sp. ZJ709]